MRISRQLAVLTFCAIAVIIVLAVSSFYCVTLLHESHNALSKTIATLEDTQEICYHAAYASAMQKSYIIIGKTESKELYLNEVGTTYAMLDRMHKKVQGNGEEEQLFNKFAKLMAERLVSLDITIKIYETKGQTAAYDRVRQGIGLTLMAHTVAAANELTAYEHSVLNEQQHIVNINAKNTQLTIVLGSIIAITIVAVTNFLFSRGLSNAVTNLLRASKNVALERFESLVDIRSNNELGDLGRAFNTLAAHLRSKSQELDEAIETLADRDKEFDNNLTELNLLNVQLKQLADFIDQSAQELDLTDKHQTDLENDLKDLISLSDMLGVSLHQVFEFSRETRVSAETLDKHCSDLTNDTDKFTAKAERVTQAIDTLWSSLPEAKELVTQLETLDSELSVLEVVSSISATRNATTTSSEISVIKDRLMIFRQKLSTIRSSLNVNISRMQQMAREALDAASSFNSLLKGSSHPLNSLSGDTKQLLQAALSSRGELSNLDRLHKRQINGLDALNKSFTLLNSTLARHKDLTAKLKWRISSSSANNKPQVDYDSSASKS